MKTMNGWRRGGMFGGDGSFGPSSFLSGTSLSQATVPVTDWMPRGQAAVAAWDALVQRVSNIDNDAERGRLLAWMGRTDTPGSNTERYTVVIKDLAAGPAADQAIAERRVSQLEGAVSELTSLVENDEKTYGTIPGTPPSQAAAGLTLKSATMAGVAVLALLVVPFILKD